jgi:hypothetical protein
MSCRGAVLGIIANWMGKLFGVMATFGFDCLRALGSNIRIPPEYVPKRDVLQMNCLSSEDLKEERNHSLTYKLTLNREACPV